MSSKQKNHTQETLSILMDWSLTVNPITTNAVSIIFLILNIFSIL